MRLKPRDDGGAVAILVAILSTVMFGFAAIVVDLGYARTIAADAQSAADVASLAGASIVSQDSAPSDPFTAANTAIKELALKNFGTTGADWVACSTAKPGSSWVQGGSGTDCILFNRGGVNPTKLQVVLPAKHVDSFFGGLVGYGGMDVSARAQATIREEAVPGCALCVLGSLDTSGAVAVDGGSAGGSSSGGNNSHVRTGGSITVQDPGAITFADTPDPAKGPEYSSRPIIRPVSDPFVGSLLPRGNPPSLTPFPAPAPLRNVTCGPGEILPEATYRSVFVTAPQSDPCTATGVTVITRLLQVKSGGSLSAAAIQLSCGTRMAPSTCAPTTAGGRLLIDPTGQMSVSSLIPGTFSIVADPNNASSMTINGALSVDQAIYGRSTPVTVGAAPVTASGRISVAQLTIGPGGTTNVNAAGGAPLPGPPFVGLYR